MKNENSSVITPAFYTDKDIARRLRVSPEWVRGQRYRRRHGLSHEFDIDPCLIGSAVRYPVHPVEDWIASRPVNAWSVDL